MNYDKRSLEKLAKKVVSGKATAAEILFLNEYYNSFEKAPGIEQVISEGDRELLKGEILSSLHAHIDSTPAVVIPLYRRRLFRVAGVAASILLIAGAIFYARSSHKPTEKLAAVPIKVSPGSDKAILTLADGKTILLGQSDSGLLATQPGARIFTQQGKLVYAPVSDPSAGTIIAYNKIETPAGGQYRADLPDGTQVWLDAASSIRYPAKFSGPLRQVELTGQAYFEVARNKAQPFRVVTRGQTVEVLGTHFNTMAYENERSSITTLLEGSVKVSGKTSAGMLIPGQQAETSTLGEGGVKIIHDANINEAIAWKNGDFDFNDEPLESIMRKISRWYDVEISYQLKTKEPLYFGGKISRKLGITAILTLMEEQGTVHFKIEERRVTVMN